MTLALILAALAAVLGITVIGLVSLGMIRALSLTLEDQGDTIRRLTTQPTPPIPYEVWSGTTRDPLTLAKLREGESLIDATNPWGGKVGQIDGLAIDELPEWEQALLDRDSSVLNWGKASDLLAAAELKVFGTEATPIAEEAASALDEHTGVGSDEETEQWIADLAEPNPGVEVAAMEASTVDSGSSEGRDDGSAP